MKLKNKKFFKSFIFFSLVTLVLGTIVTFIGIFFNKSINIGISEDNNSNNTGNTNNDASVDESFAVLEIANTLVHNTDISSITYFDTNSNKYYFSKINIDNNIVNLINRAIILTEDFNDDVNEFIKNIRYKLINNNTELIVNAYFYSKFIKQKKYRSFFKLWII